MIIAKWSMHQWASRSSLVQLAVVHQDIGIEVLMWSAENHSIEVHRLYPLGYWFRSLCAMPGWCPLGKSESLFISGFCVQCETSAQLVTKTELQWSHPAPGAERMYRNLTQRLPFIHIQAWARKGNVPGSRVQKAHQDEGVNGTATEQFRV
jgi:hypothetical protein